MTVAIIQLDERDADRLLWLVQGKAVSSVIWEQYWAEMANTISQQLTQQRTGFFQCAACQDDHTPKKNL